jgi:hypothetical protein
MSMTNSRKKQFFKKPYLGKQVLVLALVALTLSGCSTYGSAFSCGDARGAKCLAMDEIDQLISSGAIETYTNSSEKKKKRCRGGCHNANQLGIDQSLQDIDDIEIVETNKDGDADVSY